MIVPPSNALADFGVIFSDFRGYVDMCIHGTIGVVTTLFELGIVSSNKKQIMFDTPAGLVKTTPNMSNGRVNSVTVTNVPSMHLKDVELALPKTGTITASLVFGGNIYCICQRQRTRPCNKVIQPALNIVHREEYPWGLREEKYLGEWMRSIAICSLRLIPSE